MKEIIRKKQAMIPVGKTLIYCLLFALIVLFFPIQSNAESVSISGFTEPYLSAMLGIAVPGNVTKIHLNDGESVEKGQVIVSLDQQVEKLEVQKRKKIWESKAEVKSAAQQVKTLKAHLKATRELFTKTGSVRREDLENQELEYIMAVDEYQRLKDSEKREKVEYFIAKQRLDERNLIAPFSGVIAEILINVGENCKVTDPLVHLVNTSRGYFVANVELALSQKLKTGQTIELQLQNGNESVNRSGEIIFISPVVDPASALRKVKALFDNKDGKIIIGVAGVMVINVEK